MCLCNSWKHPKLALKPIKTQFKIWRFRLARVTPWKIVGGSKSYNLTINMMKKEFLILIIYRCNSWKHLKLLNTIQNLETQFGKLAKEVAKLAFLVTREENFVEVEAHEKSLVEEHDSREKDEKLGENTTTMGEVLTSRNSTRKYSPSQYPSSSIDCQ